MAKAKKLPSGSWRVLVYSHSEPVSDKTGKPVLDSTGKQKQKRIYESFTSDDSSSAGKREAEYAAAEFALNKKNKASASKKTFGAALDEYIADRSSILSPATIREYKRSRKADLPNLMNIQICDITQELIQTSINNESKKHSPKSVRNMHGLLSAVMKVYRPDFALNTALPKKIRPNIAVPTDSQISLLMKAAENTPMEIPILLAAFGPMRRSEICALDSNHVSGNTVHVEYAMVMDENNKWVIKSPKSYAGDRNIEYPDFVIEKLKGKTDRIVTLSPAQISDRFVTLLKRSNIAHFRFHDLRHYSASIQHALGIPDQYIMQRGGWGSDGVLKSVYRHAMNDKSKEMTQIANDHFKKLMQHEMQHELKNSP